MAMVSRQISTDLRGLGFVRARGGWVKDSNRNQLLVRLERLGDIPADGRTCLRVSIGVKAAVTSDLSRVESCDRYFELPGVPSDELGRSCLDLPRLADDSAICKRSWCGRCRGPP
jgi:hypothetical protein